MDCFCRLSAASLCRVAVVVASALEVLDQAWDGPVHQVAAVCQVVEVHPLDPMGPSRWASA